MTDDYAQAVRKGTQSAGQLLRQLEIREQIEHTGGSINVFAAISELDVPLLFRPLDGLLGAFLNYPMQGIMVTTQRSLSIQRFTAAHELGHCRLGHQPSLDDDNILRRMGRRDQPQESNFQELEADSFATALLLPKWLIANHMKRQGLTVHHFRRPNVIYQLSLRLGVSYEAFCWTLVRYRMIGVKQARELLKTPRREIKKYLLKRHEPKNYRGDVWLLTERDAGTRIDGSRNDLFVLKLTEQSNGGYLWNIDELRESGFAIVGDEVVEVDKESIGDTSVRRVTAQPPNDYRGRLVLDEVRPWDIEQAITRLELNLDFTGPEEEGLSRVERRGRLTTEAA